MFSLHATLTFDLEKRFFVQGVTAILMIHSLEDFDVVNANITPLKNGVLKFNVDLNIHVEFTEVTK